MNDGEIIKNKKVAKILELFDKINTHEKAYLVEVLHNKYGLTYNNSGNLYTKEELK